MKEEKVSLRDGLRATWKLLKPFKSSLIFMSVVGLFVAIADGLIPYVTGRFFDGLISVANGEPTEGLPLWAFMLAAWTAVQIFANGASWLLQRRQRITDIQAHLFIQARGFKHILQLPLVFHKNERINEVIEKVNKASWQVSSSLRTFADFAPQLLSVFIGILLVLTINTTLAGILTLGVLLYIVVLMFMLRPVAGLHDQGLREWDKAWGDAAAAVHQIESVKQATAEQYEAQKAQTGLADHTFSIWRRLQINWTNISFFQATLVFLTQLAIFIFSVQLVAEGVITVGELVAVNGYALMFFGPFVQMGHNWEIIQNGLVAAAQLDRVLSTATEPYHPEHAVPMQRVAGAVSFEHVAFRYAPDQPETLSDVSFTVEPGQSIAFVGESGVGKSTAVSLISAYYFPDEGRVLVDGHDTRQLDLVELRKRIAVVPQEVALFNDTIGNNIRYGSFDATDAQVRRAAAEAHIAEFIEGLPQQYDTLVGERGIKLSVGQKQRVAIARAFLRKPAILILDEPTSALDARTEQLITESLEKLMEGRTTFIIAHRLSTVRKADKILVFEKGKIVEQGTHEALIKQGGVYQKLYEYQIGLH